MTSLSKKSETELRAVLRARRPDLLPLAALVIAGERPWTPQVSSILRDVVADELLASGFDPGTHEPTARGLSLEGLMDELARIGRVYESDRNSNPPGYDAGSDATSG